MRQYLTWDVAAESPYILNLDTNFKPYENGVELSFERFDFRGGEPHLTIKKNGYEKFCKLVITQRYNSPSDIVDILLANDAARRMGFKEIHLILPYFPAARQDRVCNEGEPLTVKVFTDLINGCGFESVTILSPHSEVTPALLNNVEVLDELEYVSEIILANNENVEFNIVCPDAGAGKRVGKVVEHLVKSFPHRKFNLIRCEKVRDVKDGSLKEFHVQAEDLGGFPSIIVDDILSLGGTFIGLGKKLKEKGCGNLMLFTSHSDCHEGVQRMTEFFDHVYTTNSKKNWGNYIYPFQHKLTCFDITL
jgi:ribose-phosphate pyrophosphokinase